MQSHQIPKFLNLERLPSWPSLVSLASSQILASSTQLARGKKRSCRSQHCSNSAWQRSPSHLLLLAFSQWHALGIFCFLGQHSSRTIHAARKQCHRQSLSSSRLSSLFLEQIPRGWKNTKALPFVCFVSSQCGTEMHGMTSFAKTRGCKQLFSPLARTRSLARSLHKKPLKKMSTPSHQTTAPSTGGASKPFSSPRAARPLQSSLLFT